MIGGLRYAQARRACRAARPANRVPRLPQKKLAIRRCGFRLKTAASRKDEPQ
jgi:hypothetical protein